MSDFLSIGLDFLQKKDFRLAYESFSRAIEKDPNNAEAYLKRGDMHLNHLNNFNKAIEDLSKAIEINPNFAYAYKLRGISFKKIDDSNMAKQDWKKASTLGDIECSNWIKNKKFKRLDQLSKKDFEKISNENLKELFKAELKILQLENINNSFTNRIKILKDLIFEIENKVYKNPYHNHYDVQNFSQKIKKVNNKEISTTFSKRKRHSFILFTLGAIGITTLSTFFLVRYQNTLIMNQSINYSNKFKNQSIPRKFFNKLDGKIYYLTGISKINWEKYPEAIEDFTKALKLNPEDFYAFSERGWAKYQSKDYKGSIYDFTKSIAINPNYSFSFYGRGLSKTFLNNEKGAIEDFSKAIELNPNDSYALYERGYSKFNLYDYRGALEDFNKSLEIAPNSSSTILERGYTKFKLRDYEGACEDFNKVKYGIEIEKKYLKKCK